MAAANTYDIGDLVTVEATFKARTDPLDATTLTETDPDEVTLLVLHPDGTTLDTYVYGTDPEVTRISLGRFSSDLSPDKSGDWYYRFEGTLPAQAAEEKKFKVRVSRIRT